MPGSRIRETTVIANRRTAVFVIRQTRVRGVVIRDGPQPKPLLSPTIKFEAYYREGRGMAREFLKDKGKGLQNRGS